MSWRVVIRFSFNGEPAAGSAMRNELKRVLAECGIENTPWSTGTWESPASSKQDVAIKVGEVLDKLANPSKIAGARGRSFDLDHLWIYIDQAKPGVPVSAGTPRRRRGRPRKSRLATDADLAGFD